MFLEIARECLDVFTLFPRHLFEQFAGAGEDELHITEYHKMMMKWW